MIELNNAILTINVPQGEAQVYGDSSLSKLNVRAEAGRLTAISSREAAVSTSILRAMMGLWPLDEGFAAVDGELLTPQTRMVFGSRFAYLPRDVAMEGITAAQMVAAINGKSQAGESKNEMRRTLDELDYLHINHEIMATDFKDLANPMCRMLMLAVAIGSDREVIVVDSPTDEADDEHRQLIINRLKALASEGKTVVVASTDSQLLAVADHVIEPYLSLSK